VLLLVTAVLLLAMEAYRARRVDGAALPPVPLRTDDLTDGGTSVSEQAWEGDWRGQTTVTTQTGPDIDLPLGIDHTDPRGSSLAALTLKQAMTAGVFQCVAVLPGISRSGSSIAGGVFSGLTREAATRFSFLLVIPALVGATALSLGDLGQGGESAGALAVGVLAAFISGYLAIKFLVGLVSRERLTGFAYYCIAASAVGLIGYQMIGPPSSV
jgi:hypothetical protein